MTQEPGHPTPGQPSAIRPPIASYDGAGILTSFPSATHLCLALGADSPCADERCAGNLGLTARGLFTPFIATHVSIRTSDTSSRLLNRSEEHTSELQSLMRFSYAVFCLQKKK